MTFEQQVWLLIIDKVIIGLAVLAIGFWLNQRLERYKSNEALNGAITVPLGTRHSIHTRDAWRGWWRKLNLIDDPKEGGTTSGETALRREDGGSSTKGKSSCRS